MKIFWAILASTVLTIGFFASSIFSLSICAIGYNLYFGFTHFYYFTTYNKLNYGQVLAILPAGIVYCLLWIVSIGMCLFLGAVFIQEISKWVWFSIKWIVRETFK